MHVVVRNLASPLQDNRSTILNMPGCTTSKLPHRQDPGPRLHAGPSSARSRMKVWAGLRMYNMHHASLGSMPSICSVARLEAMMNAASKQDNLLSSYLPCFLPSCLPTFLQLLIYLYSNKQHIMNEALPLFRADDLY